MLVKLNDKKTIGMVMDFMSVNDLNYEVIKEENDNSEVKDGE